MLTLEARGGGALRYAGVHMREQRFWNKPLNTFQWSRCKIHHLNKDFVGFCLKFDHLNRFESKEFEKILTKPPHFPDSHGILDPLNAFLALRVVLQKDLFSLF